MRKESVDVSVINKLARSSVIKYKESRLKISDYVVNRREELGDYDFDQKAPEDDGVERTMKPLLNLSDGT